MTKQKRTQDELDKGDDGILHWVRKYHEANAKGELVAILIKKNINDHIKSMDLDGDMVWQTR